VHSRGVALIAKEFAILRPPQAIAAPSNLAAPTSRHDPAIRQTPLILAIRCLQNSEWKQCGHVGGVVCNEQRGGYFQKVLFLSPLLGEIHLKAMTMFWIVPGRRFWICSTERLR
jgi:hypothetical protein